MKNTHDVLIPTSLANILLPKGILHCIPEDKIFIAGKCNKKEIQFKIYWEGFKKPIIRQIHRHHLKNKKLKLYDDIVYNVTQGREGAHLLLNMLTLSGNYNE